MLERLDGGQLLLLSDSGEVLVAFPLSADDFREMGHNVCTTQRDLKSRILAIGKVTSFAVQARDGDVQLWGTVGTSRVHDIVLNHTELCGVDETVTITNLSLVGTATSGATPH